MPMTRISLLALALCLALPGCAKKPEEQKKSGPPAAIISVAPAQARAMQVLEQSVGEADSHAAPMVAAEVAGRITRVFVEAGDAVKAGQALAQIEPLDFANNRQTAQAEVKRLEALVDNQRKLTERYRNLVAKNFISPTKMEETESQLVALKEQLEGARAQRGNAESNLARTRIAAPIAGRVDSRLIAAGDYVKVGSPLFQLATVEKLRVRLPFPETVAARIRPGLPVSLTTPTAPGKAVQGKVQELRPMVGTSNRAFEAIIEIVNPGDWKPGASVNGAVVIEEHAQAVAVPEVSVVLRPAGKVVYVVENGKAMQRIVATGVTQGGLVEILSGLAAGETVAVDGAGFLTDKAAVMVKQPGAGQGKPAK